MKKNNRETGAKAEAIACWFLKQQGYDVLEQNFYTKVGEIDIIAKENQTLVFVEVKYRKGISGTSCRPKKTAEDPKECNDLFKEESSIF